MKCIVPKTFRFAFIMHFFCTDVLDRRYITFNMPSFPQNFQNQQLENKLELNWVQTERCWWNTFQFPRVHITILREYLDCLPALKMCSVLYSKSTRFQNFHSNINKIEHMCSVKVTITIQINGDWLTQRSWKRVLNLLHCSYGQRKRKLCKMQ